MRDSQERERPITASMNYEVRKKLDISWAEYVLLDMVYHLSAKHGHCYKSYSSIARDIGITFTGLKKMIKRLEDRELLIAVENGLQAGAAYIDIAYLQKDNNAPRIEQSSERKTPKKHVKAIKSELSSQNDDGVIEKPQLSSNKVNLVQQNELSSDEINSIDIHRDISTTNVVLTAETPKKYGKAEINEMFEYWQEAIGFPINGQVQKNRYACSNLLRRYQPEGLKRMINGVLQTMQDQFSGVKINDFISMQSQQNALMAYGKRQQGTAYNRMTEVEII